jgi:hypothetical protein
MNRTTLSIVTLAAVMSFTACDARFKPRQKPAPGPKPADTETVMIPDEQTPDELAREGKKRDEVVDPTPADRSKVPPPPTPNNPEYAIKVEGKAGYVKSPYDTQGRLIDVRGLPPGTEAECPYTRRTFLVPP